MARQLDLVFCIDSTGSNTDYLNSAKSSIENIVKTVMQSEQTDLRFALVEYKEHAPLDNSFAFKKHDFMKKISEMQRALNTMRAYGGGGDGPEAATCALDCCVNLDYREYAAKVLVWIADAPPHGLGYGGDGFKDGCPCGIDYVQTIQKFKEKDIPIYAIAIEPLAGYVRNTRDCMRAASAITNGQYLPLQSASLLPDVIIGGALEEVGMANIMNTVEKKLRNEDGFEMLEEGVREERIRKEVGIMAESTFVKQITVESAYEEPLPPIPEIYFTAKNTKELRDVLINTTPSIYLLKNVKKAPPANYLFNNSNTFGGLKRSNGVVGRKKKILDNYDDESSSEVIDVIKMDFCDELPSENDFVGFTCKPMGITDESSYYLLGSKWKDSLHDVKNGVKKPVAIKEDNISSERIEKLQNRLMQKFKKE
ncbi:Elongation factor-2 kinase [Entamoeba marina]